jgi:diguanylate cyclase (GGDEF)-like protein
MAGSQTDITEGKIGDPLTGLPNRLYLIDKMESSIEDSGRTGDLFAVLFLDLDRFKLVNDSLGHAAGDELLTGVAGRLRSSVRATGRDADVRRPVVARHGGDEFAILLNNVLDEADAARVARKIVKELDVPFYLNGRQVFATVSIGIAMSSSGHTPEDILRNADTAMYYAKARGKARFEVFDEGMRARAVARLEIDTGLRKAIDAGQLILYYQPEISLRTHRIVGYEALVRWNHPERGILGPGEFIPIAEESDLIVQLGLWVLREACRQMALWHRTIVLNPPLTISVNVSPRQLSDPKFVGDVESILADTGLNPNSLKLEITESSIMGNPEATLDTLRQLKALNIGLEIDDFGTGYSSLSYLRKLPFDTLKIDRSFVKELGTSAESLEIVKTIIGLARSLEMRVVAEGVETAVQLGKLSDLGCNCAQGFYFSKPASSSATAAILQERWEFEQAFTMLESDTSDKFDYTLQLAGSDGTREAETLSAQ